MRDKRNIKIANIINNIYLKALFFILLNLKTNKIPVTKTNVMSQNITGLQLLTAQ